MKDSIKPASAAVSLSPLVDDRDSLFIIKIGGNVVDDEAALLSFLKNFASIAEKKILVHGGGKIASRIGQQLGIEPNYIDGRRITDAATIDLVTMVYGGLVNKHIVAKLQALACNAIGLTGADANIIPATKRPVVQPGIDDDAGTNPESVTANVSQSGDVPPQQVRAGGIDYGFVGDINESEIQYQTIDVLLANACTPVLAPLTHDGKGQMLNTNADTIASTVAVSLSKKYKVRLIYCFEKKGVLADINNESSAIRLLNRETYHELKSADKLFAGILPKIDNAFAAIDRGVKEVLIGDAADLLVNVTENTQGTLIK